MAVLRLAALTLTLGVILAGCGGKDAGPPSGGDDCTMEPALCDPQDYLAGHHCIANDVRPRVYAPDTPGPDTAADPWKAGDFWTYRLTRNGVATTSTLVYYEDIDLDSGGNAQHYLVGTASEAEALDHALFSVNPMLGRIHRTLYSPHETGLHADMFYFPLCNGSTWTTGFYDTTFDLTATPQTLALPRGGQDPLGFAIAGASADGSTLRHTYSPAAKWFTSLDLRRADGVSVQMELQDHGSGKSGTYYFLRAQNDQVIDLATAPAETFVDREDAGDGGYDSIAAYLDLRRTAGTDRIEVHLRDPAGDSVACVGVAGQGVTGATQCPAGPLKLERDFEAGAWKVTVERFPGLDAATKVAGEVRVVSVYDRSGTV